MKILHYIISVVFIYIFQYDNKYDSSSPNYLSSCYIDSNQDCSTVKSSIDTDYAFINKAEDLVMPLNEEWEIIIENQRAVLVAIKNKSGVASVGIIKNKNGYLVSSAHAISEDMVDELMIKAGVNVEKRTIKDMKIKNIPVKVITFNHKVQNLDDFHLMSGIMYQIVKDGHTYMITFNTSRELINCYIPLFQNIIKNTYFGPDWY